jgi:hypothetical protein
MLEFLVPLGGVVMINSVFVGAGRAKLLVEYFSKLSPFLRVLISVMLHHDPMFFLCEVVLRRLVMIHENTLSGLSLEVGIDEPPALDFICTQQRGNNGFSLRIPQYLLLLVLFPHTFFFGRLQ